MENNETRFKNIPVECVSKKQSSIVSKYQEKLIYLLKIKIQHAVEDEEYTLAAKFRDEIKDLEKQLNQNN